MTATELQRPVPLRTLKKNPDEATEQVSEIFHHDFSRLHNVSTLTRRVLDTPVEEPEELMYKSEKNPEDFPDGGRDAYLTLLGSFIGLIIDFGIGNSLGAIESYVSSHQLKDVNDVSVSWVFTLHMGVMYFGGVFFGELFDRFGARKLLIVSTFFMTGGLFLTAQSTKLVHFLLSFSIMTAIGTSLGMVPLIGVLSRWFLKKRAFACSVATIGGLVGSSVFAIMLQQLYDRIGYQWALRCLGFMALFCMVSSILLIKERPINKPHDFDIDPVASQESNPKHNRSSALSVVKNALDLSIVKEQKFIYLTLAVFCAEIISISSLTYLASYGLTYGISETKSYLLITLVNVCGIPSRLLSGLLADRYGRFNLSIIMSVVTAIVVLAVWLPAKGNVNILFSFAVLFGISTSSVISFIPSTTSQICSAENFGKVYGTLYFFLAFLTILGMYFASLVLGDKSPTAYRNFILYEAAFSVAAVGFWWAARYSVVGNRWCKF